MTSVAKIAAAVLYEGYLLWPYRRSAQKNRQRWTFGGVYPRACSDASGGDDPWLMQTQCLVVGRTPTVTATVRFLQVVTRQVGRKTAEGTFAFVDELHVGRERYLAWEEATEREVGSDGLRLSMLTTPRQTPITIPAGAAEELLTAPDGEVVGVLRRSWECLQGAVEVHAAPVQAGLFILTVKIINTTPWSGQDRATTLKQTFLSTHTLLTVEDGEFVSLLDPPPELKGAAEACKNLKTWPVLVGDEGERRTLLSSPIILCDYPQIAPESPGDLFDGTEIDQLLTLNILALTEEEQAEICATDPRARDILARSASLTSDDFLRLHGAIRELRRVEEERNLSPGGSLERPAPQSVTVKGREIRKGSKVRLSPHPGGDILDLALTGKIAFVEAIEQDYEDRIHLAVVLEEDPGRDLGEARLPGHRFFFSPEDVEPCDEGWKEDV